MHVRRCRGTTGWGTWGCQHSAYLRRWQAWRCLAIRAQSIERRVATRGAERCGLRTHLLGLRRIEVGNDHRKALFSLQGGASAVVPVPFVCVGLVGGVLFLGAGASAAHTPDDCGSPVFRLMLYTKQLYKDVL